MKRDKMECKDDCSLVGSHLPVRAKRKTIVTSVMLALLVLSGWAGGVLANVTVYPTTLYLSKVNPAGRFTVSNIGTGPKVIDVSFSFGYPVSDSEGNISFLFLKSSNQAEPWMQSWSIMYPRRFVLPPGESQVIGVAANPPEELPDGEYWLRPQLTVRSIDSGIVTDQSSQHETINTKEVRQFVLGVNYRKGIVHTAITLHAISATVRDRRLRVLVDLQREGNAAYRGNIVCSLRDAHGNCIANLKREVAVYHSLRYRFEVSTLEISDGSYSAQVELNTDRSGDVLKSPSVKRTISFSINDGLIVDNQPDENSRVITTTPESEPSLQLTKQDMLRSEGQTVENTRVSKYPSPVHATQGRDQSDTLVKSHLRAKVLEKRLKEIDREQDMILRELHELMLIIVQ